jgi:phosphate:Na+ symporter
MAAEGGLEQGCALIIGQNIGKATSYAFTAIGASTTAKRLAVAHIRFMVRAANAIDGVTLLAAYHTAHDVVGVAVLLPAADWFTRLVERLLLERGASLTRDRAALVNRLWQSRPCVAPSHLRFRR